ncbi:hypothetical protein BST17_24865 [Mycolicibacterium bacteremicum]|uniref:4Fe-4S Wbl-type domain-containing protein n=1 Tax=Mycolicibacterium bacteremicum TaxID=564198 RepID=A0A1W9YPZ5_MYCBA|nr:hypothetical protein BST17_24865 [Mycolicibacterium bacteremicum]
MWFPESNGGTTLIAKQICLDCPVRIECLQEALDRGEEYGIWGALTSTERKQLRKGASARTVKVARPVLPEEHGYKGYRKGCKCKVCKAAWCDYIKEHQEAHRESKVCVVCGGDVRGHGKSRYCSKSCRNVVNAQRKRDQRRRAA